MVQSLEILSEFKKQRLLILGDIILDRYSWGDIDRISPEAPVMVVRADRNELRLGGAASVALLARTLEADVVLGGVVGNDTEGDLCFSRLKEATIDPRFVVSDKTRATTTKERIIGRAANRHPQQVLRIDRETTEPINSAIEDSIAENVIRQLDEFDAVVISDYAKGVCTPQLLERIIAAANAADIPIIIDPSRRTDYRRYFGATILTPNRLEAALVLDMPLSTSADFLQAAHRLRRELQLKAVLITLDKEGIALVSAAGHSQIFCTRPREVYDVTGAGDIVVAMVSLCQAGGVNLDDTIQLANVAAGLEVERFGVSPVTADEIITAMRREPFPQSRNKIVDLRDLIPIIHRYRSSGSHIVFTNGCFDLLHVGHIKFLEEAKDLGDVFIVAINSDESVRNLKGVGRPVISEKDRATMLASLSCVDYVILFDENTPHNLLHLLRPDILVKGGTYLPHEVVGEEIVKSYGGQVCVTGRIESVSTSAIIEIVKECY